MERSVEVAIIGAGQAGLATSWHLARAQVDHVVLEAGRVAETWRSRRWDSFRLITPNWAIELPGTAYAGDDPDGYMSRAELVEFFEAWVASFSPPVVGNTHVKKIESDRQQGFVLTTGGGQVRARTVVVASDGYQTAHRPAGAESLPGAPHQALAEGYRNPAASPPGHGPRAGTARTGAPGAGRVHVPSWVTKRAGRVQAAAGELGSVGGMGSLVG